ncbi:hypothetical protein IAQ61_010951, partial [Plenodomus lingam]|uniref:Predicted protein n=1 Tax=Leptosphaeria maculans (strain JN3 / isolate v23.1.3 / race Av1-4-5-6-7-8) TaxID=985895 RepID=E4ZK56_LEPMJ
MAPALRMTRSIKEKLPFFLLGGGCSSPGWRLWAGFFGFVCLEVGAGVHAAKPRRVISAKVQKQLHLKVILIRFKSLVFISYYL